MFWKHFLSLPLTMARHDARPFHCLLRAGPSAPQVLQMGHLGQAQCLTLHTLLPCKCRPWPSVVRFCFLSPIHASPFPCPLAPHLCPSLSLVPSSQKPLPPASPILHHCLTFLKAPFITLAPPPAPNPQ